MKHQKKRPPFLKSYEILWNIQYISTSAAADLCSGINILVVSLYFCGIISTGRKHPVRLKVSVCVVFFRFCPSSGNPDDRTYKNHIWTQVKKESTAQSKSMKSGRWTIVSLRARCNGWLWGCNPNTSVWLEMKRSLNVYLAVWLKLTQSTLPTIIKDIVRKWRSFLPGGTVYHD